VLPLGKQPAPGSSSSSSQDVNKSGQRGQPLPLLLAVPPATLSVYDATWLMTGCKPLHPMDGRSPVRPSEAQVETQSERVRPRFLAGVRPSAQHYAVAAAHTSGTGSPMHVLLLGVGPRHLIGIQDGGLEQHSETSVHLLSSAKQADSRRHTSSKQQEQHGLYT
jgi:hypothetical protein